MNRFQKVLLITISIILIKQIFRKDKEYYTLQSKNESTHWTSTIELY